MPNQPKVVDVRLIIDLLENAELAVGAIRRSARALERRGVKRVNVPADFALRMEKQPPAPVDSHEGLFPRMIWGGCHPKPFEPILEDVIESLRIAYDALTGAEGGPPRPPGDPGRRPPTR